jgi:hypothetical protein
VQITNPSDRYTMVATLRIPDGPTKVMRVPPGESIPVGGRVIWWPLWTLEWEY